MLRVLVHLAAISKHCEHDEVGGGRSDLHEDHVSAAEIQDRVREITAPRARTTQHQQLRVYCWLGLSLAANWDTFFCLPADQ